MAERRWHVRIERSSELGLELKQLDVGGHLVPFRATLTSGTLELELIVDVIDGVPDCTSYRVTDPTGLLLQTTEVSRGISMREALATALTYAVIERQGETDTFVNATSLELIDAVRSSVTRRNAPITDDDLRDFATRYRESRARAKKKGQRWYPFDFAESIGYSERQMWRRKKRAVDRGFLEEGE